MKAAENSRPDRARKAARAGTRRPPGSPRVAGESPAPAGARPELLAPAGGKAAWAAAVEAGADAVYLGLNDFSARSYADNFSLAELKGVIAESRAARVKVYLAMNALIKESELKNAWKLLATAASFEPDALIVQDLGLNFLAAKYFPHLERHASTLLAVHSLPGLATLKELGFTRAVLARELALDEVGALARHSPIGVEVFIHGALCFSFSGLCLMSSFLGGRSALRGGCTQPCRRTYLRGGRKSALFSTTDLETAPHLPALRQLPVAAFKIEGRMKGPDYVGRVVSAYRRLLEAPEAAWPEALAEARALLAEAPGRRTSGGFLAARIDGSLAPLGATTSGLRLGFLNPEGVGRGRIQLEGPVRVGDRLRLQAGAGQESPAFNLKGLFLDGREAAEAPAGVLAVLAAPNLPDGRGQLFKIASGAEEKAALASPLVRAVKKMAQETRLPAPRPLPAELRAPADPAAGTPAGRPGWWLWLSRTEDLADLAEADVKRVILPLTTPNVRHLKHHKRRLKNDLGKIVWSLPPLLFLPAQNALSRELTLVMEMGAREFLLSNLAQINLVSRLGRDLAGLRLWGDHRLGFLNHLAEESLRRLGLCGTTPSLEADGDVFKDLWKRRPGGPRLVYLYGRPALFTSRFPLDKRKLPVFSPKGEGFRFAEEGGESIVVAEKPVFMAPLLKMSLGGTGLIIDLRQEVNPGEGLRRLQKAVAEARSTQGTALNFKRGLL